MLIHCPTCRARVDAQEHGEAKWVYEDDDGELVGRLNHLLRCPVCHTAMLSQQQLIGFDDEGGEGPDGELAELWSEPQRLWPSAPIDSLGRLPQPISHALHEAYQCLSAQAYSASVVMSVQAIEGICREHKTKSIKLASALKELRDREVIDKKLYEWSEELRKHRNLAAHPTGTMFKKLDAQDIFDFAYAICEYVFVLTVKFDKFKGRTTKES